MPKEGTALGQAEQLGTVIDMLVTMTGTIRDAFVRQQSRPLDDIESRLHDLVEEIAFAAAKADQQMVGKPVRDRKPFLRFQSILTHLQMIAETIASLAVAPRKQIRDGIPFSDKAMDQTNLLFESQEKILRTLADIVRTGVGEGLKEVGKACRELGRSCLGFANHHESRLVGGFCLPKAAPLFLSILDRTQTLIHHELEMFKLLARWEKDRE